MFFNNIFFQRETSFIVNNDFSVKDHTDLSVKDQGSTLKGKNLLPKSKFFPFRVDPN